jgi:mutator protein MutT
VKLLLVSIAIFYRLKPGNILEVWTQVREDDGIYHGLLEFPGGKIESNEDPLTAVVREVKEEVGIEINNSDSKLMGIYSNPLKGKTILLNVFLFPDQVSLVGKGKWLSINSQDLSKPYLGEIPEPNHQMIDDLYRSLYS